MKEIGIYVHIPFCACKCYYCDFISFQSKEELIEKYVQTLKKEIDECEYTGFNIGTVYIGGGTPSIIDTKYIIEILNKIKEKFILSQNVEITIEVNPGTVTKEKLIKYKEIGINRLSIGLQSTENDILAKIGRIHTYEEFLETYNYAREVGFNNINIDLILALPWQDEKSVEKEIDKIIDLKPEHISTYSLIIEDGTKMKKMLDDGEINLLDDRVERKIYWKVKEKLEGSGKGINRKLLD